MQFFNFHTHSKSEQNGIINYFAEEELPLVGIISCGIHPWHYIDDVSANVIKITDYAASGRICAIGETGFDPASPVDISKQSEIFKHHVKISEEHKLPLIIHCVKYFQILIKLKKEINPSQKWIVHGFNSKLSLIPDLLKQGFYLSVSGKLLRDKAKSNVFFDFVPPDRIFIETDDSDEEIEELYNFVVKYTDLSVIQLNNQIAQNLKTIGL